MTPPNVHPSIYHPDIGEYIEIRNELAFKAASVVWDAIVAKYSNKSLDKQTVRVIPEDIREENLARSTIPSDELKKPEKPAKKKAQHGGVRIPWTDEEMFVIQDLPDWREAVTAYQKAYPDSKRSKNSVEQQWKKISAGIIKKRQKSKENVEKKEPVTPPAHAKLNALVVAKNGPLEVGMRVKHNGPMSSPFFGKEGVITKIGTNHQILVKIGESQTGLADHIVTVIPEPKE